MWEVLALDHDEIGPISQELDPDIVHTGTGWISFGDFANMMTGPPCEVCFHQNEW